jgi:hypothetical protein
MHCTPIRAPAVRQSDGAHALVALADSPHRNEMAPANVEYPPKPFALPAADAIAYESLADQIVAETLRAHDEFICHGRVVDLMRWKVVKEKHNMTVYKTRKRPSSRFRRERLPSDETEAVMASPHMPAFYPDMSKRTEQALSETYPSVTFLESDSEDELDEFSYAGSLEENVLEKAKPERVPMVFCTGVIPGTVEDAALGFLADTEARSWMRNSTTREVIADDMRILAQMQEPTEEDPFRFLGIKWCVHTPGGAAAHFIKPRDYVMIESTGMALDSEGIRFGYVVCHSIDFDEVPDFRKFGVVRVKFSACHIIRPHATPGAIEVFCRGFMDTGGDMGEGLCTYRYCDGLLTVPQTIEEAYTKKLLWLLQTRYRADKSRMLASLCVSDTCPCCHEKLHTGFAKLLDGGNSMCHLCRHTICRKCAVKKILPLDVGGPKQLRRKGVDFCVSCYLEAKNRSAWQVAVEMMTI